MNVSTILIYIITSIGLSIILNNLEKIISEKYYHSIIVTQIYLLLLSGIFTSISIDNNNIYLITLFELFIRIFYFYCIKEEPIHYPKKYFQKDLLNIVIAYLLNIYFINQVETVFLTTSELKILIWICITIYLYTNVKTLFRIKKNNQYFLQNKNGEYIVIEYAKLKNKYQNMVTSKYKELIPLIYSIMIYENYKRPFLLRKLDLFLYKIDGEKRKFGIMQVMSKEPISNEKSILLTIKKLERLYTKLPNSKDKIQNIIKKYYYKNIPNEVFFIYHKITSFQ